ncbi:MAG: adenylate/guanylate cyclase domain-containing protein [Rhizobiaceae bacterium]|nr:adenylate/guanylate cyclase domain-containing protein [Rhizobiaceae bacterium]
MTENQDFDAPSSTELSFEVEELAARKTAFKGRLFALAAIAVLTTFLSPWPGFLYIYFLLLLFVALGYGSYLAAKASWKKPWHIYAFVTADFILLTFTLLYPNPLIPFDYPAPLVFRFGTFIYHFVLLAGLAYLYKPRLVLWGGISAALSWLVGVVWMMYASNAVVAEPAAGDLTALMQTLSNPLYVDMGIRMQEVIVLLITAGLLALAVQRTRSIALRQAALASERTNLARYFPRKTVDMLATRTNALSRPREHNAAVLFADIISFTAWAETRSPRETIVVLREVHQLLAETIFKHDGTLDKFIGDGLMATFGTPEPSRRDAINALSAAVEMVAAFEAWRQARKDTDAGELKLAIGVHYGPVIIGDIGVNRRLEFAVLGDTVNVASRLEKANREINCRCIVSTDLVEAARFESPEETSTAIEILQSHGPLTLRGRRRATPIFILP